jgi:hypothetical protein
MKFLSWILYWVGPPMSVRCAYTIGYSCAVYAHTHKTADVEYFLMAFDKHKFDIVKCFWTVIMCIMCVFVSIYKTVVVTLTLA